MNDQADPQNGAAESAQSNPPFWRGRAINAPARPGAPTYWLSRFVILRWLGLVYLVAFAVAANQLVPLVGEHGLLPARLFLAQAQAHYGWRVAGLPIRPAG